MKKTLKKGDSIKESGMMISAPGPEPAKPNFIELLAREVEKLHDAHRIDGRTYGRARDLLPILRTSIFNIYSRRERGLEQALMFLLKQARR